MDGWLHNDAQPRANPLEPALPLPGATNNKKTPAARSIAVRGTVEYKPTSDFSARSADPTSELQSLMRFSYAVFSSNNKRSFTYYPLAHQYSAQKQKYPQTNASSSHTK